jgi:hypothetical protein
MLSVVRLNVVMEDVGKNLVIIWSFIVLICHDTGLNGTQHNDTGHNDAQH